MIKTNVCGADRLFRLISGIGLVAWAAFGGPAWAWIGMVPLITGAIGFCPIYALVGTTTCRRCDKEE